jgi:hypothetical protein
MMPEAAEKARVYARRTRLVPGDVYVMMRILRTAS